MHVRTSGSSGQIAGVPSNKSFRSAHHVAGEAVMPSDLVDLAEDDTGSDAEVVGSTAGIPDDSTVSERRMERGPPRTQKLKRRLHSIRDVGDQAHTSHATTWRLIKRGVLKTVKIGRRTFVTDESLERLLVEGAP